MDIKEINQAIMSGNLTNQQLDSVAAAVRFARAELTRKNKYQFNLGSQVKFTSNRDGRTYFGTVKKIAIKYITVNTGNLLYKVPANMLEAA